MSIPADDLPELSNKALAESSRLSEIGSAPPEASPRNFLVLVAYQVVLRVGWIFKTESIIMPAVLDSLGGPGWVRGCLPMLNRVAQSVAPLLLARHLASAPRKKWGLMLSSLGMALTLLLLAGAWSVPEIREARWMAGLFLLLYTFFFASTGINQVSYSALQGKLIPVTSRGRLLATANTSGAVLAITSAWFLLPLWLSGSHQYVYIFAFAGLCFSLNIANGALLREPAAGSPHPLQRLSLASAWHLFNSQRHFRRLAIVGVFYGTSVVLFPHYQALARQQMGLDATAIPTWVIVQNIGNALCSAVVGPIADRFGNRLALRCLLGGLVTAPLLAIVLAALGRQAGPWYSLVFLLVGLTPVGFRVFDNYVLELIPAAQHPQYLSIIAVSIATPILFSPLVGWMLDHAGFAPVFLVVAAIVAVGFVLTFALFEPRSGRE